MTHHGSSCFHRGINPPKSRYYSSGRFGRLFPNLPALDAHEDDLKKLAALMTPDHGTDAPNPRIPAGHVFLGQFIDHDITLDTTSSLEQQNDPEAIQNFRTPVLELDNVYGTGPEPMPFLYSDGVRLLVEDVPDGKQDVPRNSQDVALIGDPRNDENVVVSQLQLAYLKFHNAVVDHLSSDYDGEALFHEAQRLVRWHHQWIVLHEFLPHIVGEDLVHEIYLKKCGATGRKFYDWKNEPFIPVEFAVAAYRFGHSQVPSEMKVNDTFYHGNPLPLFDPSESGEANPEDLRGGIRDRRRYVEWEYFFDTGSGNHQHSQRIDTVMANTLFALPFGDNPSLAERNLLRGQSFGLPSGQAVARAMCESPLSADEIRGALSEHKFEELHDLGFVEETPLWYYILLEAEVREDGKHLGRVGGRIVAEVLIGLMEGDRLSFVRMDPNWTPTLSDDEDFSMVDMLTMAGVMD